MSNIFHKIFDLSIFLCYHKTMKKYENLIIQNVGQLKQPTIYFFLKNCGISENYIKHLRSKKNSICLNDEFVNIRAKIQNGDCLKIEQSPTKKTEIELCEGNLEILFEDDDFLIVNKSHNLSCMPNRSHFSNNLGGQICNYMRTKDSNFTLRILNRLDKETAGIVVVSKNIISYQKCILEKEYNAICKGKIDEDFTINKSILTIKENGINQLKRIVSEKGKHAVTHVHKIKYIKDNTLISLKLETGRTHQIRVHLSHTEHPLLGDQIYGTDIIPNHTMLILKKITFTHFRNNKKISIEIPYPNEWTRYLE